MTEAYNIIFKDYPLTINMSEKQRAKRWQKQDEYRLPEYLKKGIDSGRYVWSDIKGSQDVILYDQLKQEYVLKNPNTAGKPKIVKITGQKFWEGGSNVEWYRKKLKEQLTGYYVPRIHMECPDKIFAPKDHYIQFEFIFYTPIKPVAIGKIIASQDANNHAYPYIKVFHDVMQELEIILHDGPSIARGDYYRYVDIPDDVERRMEVKIHFCKNRQGINQ